MDSWPLLKMKSAWIRCILLYTIYVQFPFHINIVTWSQANYTFEGQFNFINQKFNHETFFTLSLLFFSFFFSLFQLFPFIFVFCSFFFHFCHSFFTLNYHIAVQCMPSKTVNGQFLNSSDEGVVFFYFRDVEFCRATSFGWYFSFFFHFFSEKFAVSCIIEWGMSNRLFWIELIWCA